MYKEFIIIMLIITLVLGLDAITNQYTSNSVKKLCDELFFLKGEILNENQGKSQKQMQSIEENWGNIYKVMAYYIEHDELEKVATELTKLAAHIDTEDYQECVSQIDTTVFILEHIQEKEKFDGRSIF